jgi:hypothetical protein
MNGTTVKEKKKEKKNNIRKFIKEIFLVVWNTKFMITMTSVHHRTPNCANKFSPPPFTK